MDMNRHMEDVNCNECKACQCYIGCRHNAAMVTKLRAERDSWAENYRVSNATVDIVADMVTKLHEQLRLYGSEWSKAFARKWQAEADALAELRDRAEALDMVECGASDSSDSYWKLRMAVEIANAEVLGYWEEVPK